MHDRLPASIRLRLVFAAAAVVVWASPVPAATVRPAGVRSASGSTAGATRNDEAEDMIPNAWLGETVSVEQAEADHPGIADDRVQRSPEAARPFGFENPRWEALKAKMRAGDVLRSFASPPASWRHLAGRAGIALVRDGSVIDTMVTMMN